MKRNKIIVALSGMLILVMVSLNSCYKDVYYPDFDPNAPISFNADLLPVFTKNCALSGCHDAVPAHNPALTADKAFTALNSGGFINKLLPEQSKIYTEVKSGSMPPSGALNSSDVQKILYWIKNGAPNN
jgi:hypothetical protein